jgi:hypothetical protein
MGWDGQSKHLGGLEILMSSTRVGWRTTRFSVVCPDAMRTRSETVEHPFGTMKMRMGATHFLMKTLPKVATEMALHVLAYNLTRVLNIVSASSRLCRRLGHDAP